MQKIIDTHIHVWDFDQANYPWLEGNQTILNRCYHIEEIEMERTALNISKGVLVQAANNLDDTNWMLKVASATEWVGGVVGWLPLTDPEFTQKLLEGKYLNESYFKGVRHLIHDESDPKWLLQTEVIESLRVLAINNIPFDVVGVSTEHIETVLKLIDLVPDLRLVFDHLNQPPILKKERFGAWGELIKEAAKHENCFAKISGLGTASGNFGKWTKEDIKPYVAFVLACFGTNRCMCGGDWPVSLLAGGYTKTWNSYIQVIDDLVSAGERDDVFYNTANEFYKLNGPV